MKYSREPYLLNRDKMLPLGRKLNALLMSMKPRIGWCGGVSAICYGASNDRDGMLCAMSSFETEVNVESWGV